MAALLELKEAAVNLLWLLIRGSPPSAMNGQNRLDDRGLGRIGLAAVIGGELVAWRKAVPAIVSVIVGGLLFSSTGSDDPYITYWSAETLARHGEIVNYNGDRVEQSSSLAHVLLLACLAKTVPLSMPTIGAFVSIFFGAATVILTQKLAATVNPRISLVAGLLTAFSPCLVYWSLGGLETTLAAFLSVWLLLSYSHFIARGPESWSLLTACTALYLLVRPESFTVISVVLSGGIFLLLFSSRRLRSKDLADSKLSLNRYALLLFVIAVLSAAIFLFRLVYFGSFFPQPVVAKSSGVSARVVSDGIVYLKYHAFNRFGLGLWLLAACGVALVVYRRVAAVAQVSAAEMVIALYLAAYTAFVIFVGGDWMEGGRFLVPVAPMVAIMAAYLLDQADLSRAFAPVTLLLVCLQLGGTLYLARYESTGGPIWTTLHRAVISPERFSWFETANRLHFRDIPVVLRLNNVIRRLRAQQSKPVSIMSGQMGMVAYYASLYNFGAVRMIDRYGLATTDFVSCPVTQTLNRSPVGLMVSYTFFFEHRKQLAQTCSLNDPDIIFDVGDLDRDREEILRKNGYSIIYHQVGSISNSSQWFPGIPVRAEFIALRNDLVKSLWKSATPTEVWQWPAETGFVF